ncbi:MAG: chromate transporter [Saccharofermentanales bacterium]|jgi:chromate transporter|nr:chromate transporter [Clostridiaceae bacterium]
MTLLLECLKLFFTFFKIGVVGFGGGYAMLSMIMVESMKYSITLDQLADLNALDMIIPGPIAINAATYVGYLHAGLVGSIAATLGIIAPSLIIVSLVLHFIERYRNSRIMNSVLEGIKPAAVGLIAAAALTIASGILLFSGVGWANIFVDPLGTISFFLLAVFLITVVANIAFRVNPILLTILAGVAGALFYR